MMGVEKLLKIAQAEVTEILVIQLNALHSEKLTPIIKVESKNLLAGYHSSMTKLTL